VVTLSFECRSSVAIRLYYALPMMSQKAVALTVLIRVSIFRNRTIGVRYSVTAYADKRQAGGVSPVHVCCSILPACLAGMCWRFGKLSWKKARWRQTGTPAPEDGDAKTEATAAALEDYKKVEAAKDKATAESIQTIRTTVNGNSAAIQQQAKKH
ncbi:hypothetical protein, partial [Bergeriella denitrificans]|uniref:hypothetical protein n=1 Tax=Bergeriella denitrificans TaxID=494 RepID=UPI001C49C2A4